MTWHFLKAIDERMEATWEEAFKESFRLLSSLNSAERRKGIAVDASNPTAPGAIRAARETQTTLWLCEPKRLASVKEALKANGNSLKTNGCLELADGDSFVFIATSGSTGEPKWVRHTWAGLFSAAKRLKGTPADASLYLSPLPLWHVSGLMPWVRAEVLGGTCQIIDSLQGVGPRHAGSWISLVPTQLFRLLESDANLSAWRALGGVFVGGSSLDDGLAERARRAMLPLAPCYGMTETAAMVATLWPDQFLQGNPSCGSPLPGIAIQMDGSGLLSISGTGLMQGYEWQRPVSKVHTTDIGAWTHEQGLTLLGRSDRVIISGGENISLQYVENTCLQISGIHKALASSEIDDEWGQRLILEVWLEDATLTPFRIMEKLRSSLPCYCVPKTLKVNLR